MKETLILFLIHSYNIDSIAIKKLENIEILVKENYQQAKKELLKILDSDVSDTIKGKALELLGFLPPDTLENAQSASQLILDVKLFKKRKTLLWKLFYFLKSKKSYKECEDILREIIFDYPSDREKAQEELFNIFLITNKLEYAGILKDKFKRSRPDLFAIFLIKKRDTIEFLFFIDSLRNLKKLPYSDSVLKIYRNITGIKNKKTKDPDIILFEKWKEYYFKKKNKRKADSLKKILERKYGYIIPVFPDSMRLYSILKNILTEKKEIKKTELKKLYKKGLYELIYLVADPKDSLYLPSIYFLLFLGKNVKIPDTLKGDSLWTALILNIKYSKGLRYFPEKFSYLKGRILFDNKKFKEAVNFLTKSKYLNDISKAIFILSKQKKLKKIDSIIKIYNVDSLMKYYYGLKGLLNFAIWKEDQKLLIKIYYQLIKNNIKEILKKYKVIFSEVLVKTKKWKELFKLGIILDDKNIKSTALLYLNKPEKSLYYILKGKIKSKTILRKVFEYYAKKGDKKVIDYLNKILPDELEEEKKWINSVFNQYKKAIEFIKNKRFNKGDSILKNLQEDRYLKGIVYYKRAGILFYYGKLKEAKRFFKKSFELTGNKDALYNYTVVLKRLVSDSFLYYAELYDKITRYSQENYFAKKRIAYYMMDKNKYNKAKEIMDKLKGLSPDIFEEKELKFFYISTLRALLMFRKALKEGIILYIFYPFDKLFSKTIYNESSELAKILNFPFSYYINYLKK